VVPLVTLFGGLSSTQPAALTGAIMPSASVAATGPTHLTPITAAISTSANVSTGGSSYTGTTDEHAVDSASLVGGQEKCRDLITNCAEVRGPAI
jgi:hypothetical protein